MEDKRFQVECKAEFLHFSHEAPQPPPPPIPRVPVCSGNEGGGSYLRPRRCVIRGTTIPMWASSLKDLKDLVLPVGAGDDHWRSVVWGRWAAGLDRERRRDVKDVTPQLSGLGSSPLRCAAHS